MAVTIANRGGSGARIGLGNGRIRVVDITGPASYTTGGETLSAADIKALSNTTFGIGDIACLIATCPTGHQIELDAANSKIKYYNGTTEIASTTNLSAIVSRCIVIFGIVNG